MSDPIFQTETAARAFLSYARRDDEREGGRILRLATLIREEFESLTGSTIEIFTDREKIEWGDDFRQKLDEALVATTFFIPVLTPTYFLREECRKEMDTFVTSATRLGLRELLLSIRYLPVPNMSEDSTDSLKAVAAKMSYEEWDGLRLKAEDSPEHRTAINRLARRLVSLTSRLEEEGSPDPQSAAANGGSLAGASPVTASHRLQDVPPQSPAPSSRTEVAPIQTEEEGADEDDEDAPGTLDLIADAVPAIEDWSATLGSITEATQSFGDKFRAATENLPAVNAASDSLARRVLAFRALAKDVEPDLARLETLSKEYAVGVRRIDAGVRAIASLATEGGDGVATARKGMKELAESSRDAMEKLAGAADIARENSGHSRDLRPVLRRFETAARNIVDASRTIEEWEDQFPADM